MTPGSRSPARVPMTRPSIGVNPMLVSTLLRFSIAQTLAPLPRWQTMWLRRARRRARSEGVLEWEHNSYRFTRVLVSPVITLFDEQSFAAAGETMEIAHDTCLVANSVRSEVIIKPLFRLRQ